MSDQAETIQTLQALGWQTVDLIAGGVIVARYADKSIQLLPDPDGGISRVNALLDNTVRAGWVFEDYPAPDEVHNILALIGAW